MSFNENQLIEALSELPLKNRVAFAASCCERLLPNYEAFYCHEKWGDYGYLNCALESVWRFVTAGKLPTKQLSDLIYQCESVIPDSDEFTSIFTGAASNAAAAVIYTLQSCLDGDPKRVALVGRLAVDTTYEYLYVVNTPNTGYHAHDSAFDQWIQQAPLMVAELQKQLNDLETLKSQARLDSYFLDKLRQEASRVGIFPIERGLAVVLPSPMLLTACAPHQLIPMSSMKASLSTIDRDNSAKVTW
jgi:uncharacterized protein YjaG (DUF416 family)